MKRNTKRLSVVGVSRKTCVTHFCLSLANFIGSVLRQKVIYIELTDNSSLLSVVGLKQVKVANANGYKYKGVTYILTHDVNEVLTLMNEVNAWLIVDMNHLNEETKPIFMNSNKRIVIGSLSPWCQREYYRFMEVLKQLKIDINEVILMNNMRKNEKSKSFRQIYGANIVEMPVVEDPFSLREKEFEVLINMLQ